MNDRAHAEPAAADARLESVYARAIPRMLRVMLGASALLLAPAFWFYGWLGAIGFAAGAAVSYLNFLTLARGVEGLAERIVNRQSREKGRKIVLRFVLRYGLVAIVAYAIFKGSALAFRGFLWGLCVLVAAMMVEAGFEGYVAFRRD
jgi:ATP synthase I subunit